MIAIAEALQEYGGWGVSGICMTAIWRMAAYIKQLTLEMRQEAKESVIALVETREAMHAFRDAMERLSEGVKEIEHVEMVQTGGTRHERK